MNKYEAIIELNPTVVSIVGDTAYDENGNEITYDADAVQSLIDSKAYQDNRASEYPSIGEQLDMIFHSGLLDGSDWATTIQAVKDKYPKE